MAATNASPREQDSVHCADRDDWLPGRLDSGKEALGMVQALLLGCNPFALLRALVPRCKMSLRIALCGGGAGDGQVVVFPVGGLVGRDA